MSLAKVLQIITKDIIERQTKKPNLLVAIDGPDGAGKSMFAANLASHLKQLNIPVIHTSIDGFHRLRAERYVRGRHSPEGFFSDSYDYDKFKEFVIAPFLDKNDRAIRLAAHDVETDEMLSPEPIIAQPGTVLIVDGIFLHRDELLQYWDYSIFLDVDFQQTFHRMAIRDNNSADPFDTLNTRYREGQLLYFERCNPKDKATVVINNSDFDHPKIITS